MAEESDNGGKSTFLNCHTNYDRVGITDEEVLNHLLHTHSPSGCRRNRTAFIMRLSM